MTPGGTTNRDAIVARLQSATWQGDQSTKYLYSLGLLLDELREVARQGMRAHMPGLGTPDALPYIGNDRQIDRGYQETDGAYALRNQQAFDIWATAGNAWSVLRNLLGFVSPLLPIWRTVTSTGIWDSMNDATAPVAGTPTSRVYPVAPGNWNWDGNQTSWWRFYTILVSLNPTVWSPEGNWGDGSLWGDGLQSWGLTASVSQVQSVRKIIAKWKAANTFCHWMIVNFNGSNFLPTSALGGTMPDGHWAHWSKLSGNTRIPSRFGSARYCDGVI